MVQFLFLFLENYELKANRKKSKCSICVFKNDFFFLKAFGCETSGWNILHWIFMLKKEASEFYLFYFRWYFVFLSNVLFYLNCLFLLRFLRSRPDAVKRSASMRRRSAPLRSAPRRSAPLGSCLRVAASGIMSADNWRIITGSLETFRGSAAKMCEKASDQSEICRDVFRFTERRRRLQPTKRHEIRRQRRRFEALWGRRRFAVFGLFSGRAEREPRAAGRTRVRAPPEAAGRGEGRRINGGKYTPRRRRNNNQKPQKTKKQRDKQLEIKHRKYKNSFGKRRRSEKVGKQK